MLNAEIIKKIAMGIAADAQHVAIDASIAEDEDDLMALASHADILLSNVNRLRDAVRATLEERTIETD